MVVWVQSVTPAGVISATPPATPVATYIDTKASVNGNVNPQVSGTFTAPANASLQTIFMIWAVNTEVSSPATSVKLQTDVGSLHTGTIVFQPAPGAGNIQTGMGYVALDAGDAGATTFTITLDQGGILFIADIFTAWSVPSANISSLTATDTQFSDNAIATSRSLTLATSSGGFIIAAASGNATNGLTAPVTITGTESFTDDNTGTGTGNQVFGSAHVNGIATNAASSVSVTWGGVAGHVTLIAGSWR